MRQRLYSRLLDLDVYSDCVGSTADALARLDELPYSLVIADIELGIDPILSRVAALERNRRPIVLVVAASGEAARSLDVEIVQIVLRKPLNVEQLVDLISSCVRSSVAARRGHDVEAGDAERRDRTV